MEIKDRINEFISYKQLTNSAFEDEIGISNGAWVNAKTVSEKVLIKFIARFPEVSACWLLKGKGKMFDNDFLEEVRLPESSSNAELIQLCKLLVSNYKQRDEVMNKLVSMVDNTKF